jgi:hypothetical protein
MLNPIKFQMEPPPKRDRIDQALGWVLNALAGIGALFSAIMVAGYLGWLG